MLSVMFLVEVRDGVSANERGQAHLPYVRDIVTGSDSTSLKGLQSEFEISLIYEFSGHTSVGPQKSTAGETTRGTYDDGRDCGRGCHRHDGFIWTRSAAQHALAVQGARPL